MSESAGVSVVFGGVVGLAVSAGVGLGGLFSPGPFLLSFAPGSCAAGLVVAPGSFVAALGSLAAAPLVPGLGLPAPGSFLPEPRLLAPGSFVPAPESLSAGGFSPLLCSPAVLIPLRCPCGPALAAVVATEVDTPEVRLSMPSSNLPPNGTVAAWPATSPATPPTLSAAATAPMRPSLLSMFITLFSAPPLPRPPPTAPPTVPANETRPSDCQSLAVSPSRSPRAICSRRPLR